MGKFVIKKTKTGKLKFDLKAQNGQVILSSQSYKSRSGCKNGINSVMKNSKEDKRYDRKTAKDGSPYFNLKAANSQIIGTSEMYSNTAAMENGIASVKKNGPGATVEDKS
ncbi:MAG: YegP family protein [Arenibacter sp.]|nr:YegP family protein [Eudoraea sp.]NNG09582.1 YegP family protein [Arenibacter sp.]